MILKSLQLENIRSYKSTTVEFPLGTTLFEGDVGSGKSTILSAIEFALFGLGDQHGASLLRVGTNEGSVTLTFEVDGEEYEAHRTLVRRRQSVHQGEGHIKTRQGTTNLSASELKLEILRILNFREPPDPRAQSVIYRYAVYTPQEEMKVILSAGRETRLQTLRKAFGIEDYKIASQNALNLATSIKDRIGFLAGQVSDLEQKIKDLAEQKAALAKQHAVLRQLQKKAERIKAELTREETKLEKLRSVQSTLKKAEADIPHLKEQIKEKAKQIAEFKSEIADLREDIATGIKPGIIQLRTVRRPTTKTVQALTQSLTELREGRDGLKGQEVALSTKIGDYESIQQRGICPTCDRPADSKEFEEKKSARIVERQSVSMQVNECEEVIEQTEATLENLKKYNEAQKQLREQEGQLRKTQGTIRKRQGQVVALQKGMNQSKKELEAAQEELSKLKDASTRLGEQEQTVGTLREDRIQAEGEVAASKEATKQLKARTTDLLAEIRTKEQQAEQKVKLENHRIWLVDYFVPTLEQIEKHVMITINQEFNQQFQKWFSSLVEDPAKDARIDEDFAPIVQQEGYEQDVSFLSGGEKTSVALAYRLALNSIVQRVATGMKSNLLILDEPTDGFSREQLSKVREILDELKCPQIIIVSHERDLESFADHVVKVAKIHGVSAVAS